MNRGRRCDFERQIPRFDETDPDRPERQTMIANGCRPQGLPRPVHIGVRLPRGIRTFRRRVDREATRKIRPEIPQCGIGRGVLLGRGGQLIGLDVAALIGEGACPWQGLFAGPAPHRRRLQRPNSKANGSGEREQRGNGDTWTSRRGCQRAKSAAGLLHRRGAPVEIPREFGGRLVTFRRILHQAPADDSLEILRGAGRRRRRLLNDLGHNLLCRCAVERPAPRDHLVKHHTQRPEVRAPIEGSPCACSGDMYGHVPTIVPGIVGGSAVMVVAFGKTIDPSVGPARPKSSNLTVPSGVILTFDGLRSR